MGPAFRLTDPAELDAVSGALVGPTHQLMASHLVNFTHLIRWHWEVAEV